MVELSGRGRIVATDAAETTAARVSLGAADLTIQLEGESPLTAGYRDVTTLTLDQGRALLVLGGGDVRLILEHLGAGLGTLAREIRDRRARQLLADRLVQLPDEALEMVEYLAEQERGVALLAYHPWGLVLMPLDERRPWRALRRSEIGAVTEPGPGRVRVEATAVARVGERSFELPSLGAAAAAHRARLLGLRDGALADAAAIVGQSLPDAPFGVRRHAASVLVDGRPAMADQLADAWPWVERAMLAEPEYAATYTALRSVAGADAPVWIALAPESPGAREARAWFLVALPGNLVAMELVSEGSHATYCFRIVPRDRYRGEPPRQLLPPAADAVADVSEALIDSRFLREPLALSAAQLAQPRYLRYRLALAALPSLAAARRRFVARLIHTSEEGWRAALQDLVRWHEGERDDAAEWPGRRDQESAMGDAGDVATATAGGV